MRSSGSLCGSFFQSKQRQLTRCLILLWIISPDSKCRIAGRFFSGRHCSTSQDSYCRRAGSAHRSNAVPLRSNGDVDDGLVPAGTDRFDLGDGNRPIPSDKRHQKNRSENPSPARSRAPANRVHPPSRPADRSVPEQKLRFVCNDDIRAAGFIKGITDISIGQDDWHPAVQTDAREDRLPPFRSSIHSLISPKPSSPTSHHRTA